MAVRAHRRLRLRQLWLPVVAAVYLGYFGFHAFHGTYGLVAKAEFEAEAVDLRAELAALRAETAELERHAALLRPESMVSDAIDEEARRRLNFIGPNEIVLMP